MHDHPNMQIIADFDVKKLEKRGQSLTYSHGFGFLLFQAFCSQHFSLIFGTEFWYHIGQSTRIFIKPCLSKTSQLATTPVNIACLIGLPKSEKPVTDNAAIICSAFLSEGEVSHKVPRHIKSEILCDCADRSHKVGCLPGWSAFQPRKKTWRYNGCDLIQVKFECQDMRSMCSQWVLICHRTYGQPDDRDWRDELRWIKVVKVHLSQLLEKHLKFSKGGILSSGSNLGCQFATKLEPYYLHLSTNIYKWLQACIGCLAHFEAQILLTFESTFDSCIWIWYVFDVVLNVIWREVPCIGSLSCGFFEFKSMRLARALRTMSHRDLFLGCHVFFRVTLFWVSLVFLSNHPIPFTHCS